MIENSASNLLQEEQNAFDSVLPELIGEHKGEFVVFKDKGVVGFFPTFQDAYSAALRKFGLGEVFLISEVEPPRRSSSALTWDLAVL